MASLLLQGRTSHATSWRRRSSLDVASRQWHFKGSMATLQGYRHGTLCKHRQSVANIHHRRYKGLPRCLIVFVFCWVSLIFWKTIYVFFAVVKLHKLCCKQTTIFIWSLKLQQSLHDFCCESRREMFQCFLQVVFFFDFSTLHVWC